MQVLGDDTAGLYVAGWLKRGPSGIIGTNINDAKETLQTLLHDAKLGNIPEISGVDGASGADAVRQAVCKARGTDSSIGLVVDGFVDFSHEVVLPRLCEPLQVSCCRTDLCSVAVIAWSTPIPQVGSVV